MSTRTPISLTLPPPRRPERQCLAAQLDAIRATLRDGLHLQLADRLPPDVSNNLLGAWRHVELTRAPLLRARTVA